MKPSEFFAILNHFAVSKDATQLLSLSDNLEVCSSKLFGNGKIVVGKDAPVAFRTAIKAYAASKKSIKLSATSLYETAGGGIVNVEVVNGRSKSVSVFSILIRNKQLIALVES